MTLARNGELGEPSTVLGDFEDASVRDVVPLADVEARELLANTNPFDSGRQQPDDVLDIVELEATWESIVAPSSLTILSSFPAPQASRRRPQRIRHAQELTTFEKNSLKSREGIVVLRPKVSATRFFQSPRAPGTRSCPGVLRNWSSQAADFRSPQQINGCAVQHKNTRLEGVVIARDRHGPTWNARR